MAKLNNISYVKSFYTGQQHIACRAFQDTKSAHFSDSCVTSPLSLKLAHMPDTYSKSPLFKMGAISDVSADRAG